MDIKSIQRGWEVYGSDGKKVGYISELDTSYVQVTRGFLFHTNVFVPLDSIERLDTGRVYLSVPSEGIDAMNWHQPPAAMATPMSEDAQIPGDLPIPTEEAFREDLQDFIEKRDPLHEEEFGAARHAAPVEMPGVYREEAEVKIRAMERPEFPEYPSFLDVEMPEEYPEQHA